MASPAKNTISVSLSSSSSPSIPSRPNPKPRNSETGDLMRRSFRGSPFPADMSRRNSIGRECARVEFADKENQNDKDQISNLLKAPKGSKHFMSPTISAVSKINPSPRKKILSDKNEVSRSFDKTHHHQVRSSVSFSDVISIIGEDKEQEQKQIDEEESHDLTVTDFDVNYGDKRNGDLEDDDSSFKISPLPPTPSGPYTFPVIGTHEVDPLVAPYDPKKNYLSPRPQFLHYKLNPRIEHCLDECKQLEELFISESSSSDTDLSAEESQQEEEVASQEGVDEIQVEEEFEVEIGEEEHLEAVEESDEEEEEEEVVVGENTEEEEEKTHQFSRQSRFKTSKLPGWILALGVAYLLVVSSVTLTQPNIIQDSSQFYKLHISPEIKKSARESFEQLSEKLGMWAGSTLAYMDKLISSLGEEEGYGPFHFHNLTDLLEDKRWSDSVFRPTSGGDISVAGLLVDSLEMDIKEVNGGHQEPEEPENGGGINLEAVYKEDGNEFEQESEHGEVDSEMVDEFDKKSEIKTGGEGYSESLAEEEEDGGQETDDLKEQREFEGNDQKNVEEGHESETRSAQNDEKNLEEAESDVHQLDDVEPSAISGHEQVVDTEVANAETALEEEGIREIAGNSFDISAETTNVDGNELEEESGLGEVVNTISGHEQADTDLEGESELDEVVDDAAGAVELFLSSDQKKAIVLFSTVMVLLAVTAGRFFSLAKRRAKPVTHEDGGEPTTISDTKEVNFEHVPVENLIKEKLSSLHFQEEEKVDEDRNREVSSFPSEMSFSFHKNRSLHSCSNNKDDLKEYQSGGGGKKSNDSGESMASSASEYSIGSVSYGSFTTYEKIQKRSGRKEEEMVTPVRRSSRIRNHQHSGQ